MLTATPAPPAECPREDPSLVPTFALPDATNSQGDLGTNGLAFLNAGGGWRALVDYVAHNPIWAGPADPTQISQQKDLNNDGVPELLLESDGVFLYTCHAGQYALVLNLPSAFSFAVRHVLSIQDMTLDGIPEILLDSWDTVSVGKEHYHQILGWDGAQFRYLMVAPACDTYNVAQASPCFADDWIMRYGHTGLNNLQPGWEVRDTDHNGTQEVVLSYGIGHGNDALYNGPWRVRTSIYMWNGQDFVRTQHALEPPRYRFQALQDADEATWRGQYVEALALYQAVIFSDELEWWSAARQSYEFDVLYTDPNLAAPTPDPKEWPNLAAYARYRLILLHLLEGRTAEAEVVYTTLQEKFPAGAEGHVYAELAAVFWAEYQAAQRMNGACAKAVAFADQQGETILYYLGAYHHGWQSERYWPETLCPFK